jgi:hypothetical protein
MTPPDSPTLTTRTRYFQWGAVLALILLAPAILIPFLLSLSQQPAFSSLDDLDISQIRSLEVIILNRPDGGPDIGTTKAMHNYPASDYERVVATMKPFLEHTSDPGRGIWLGRMVITMKDRRRQMILFHRSKTDEFQGKSGPVEMRIGRRLFLGPPVNELTKKLQEIAGIVTADDKL